MNEEPEPTSVPLAPPQKLQADSTEVEYLRQIAGHLKSIRSMLTFFTVVFILWIIVQFLAGFLR